MLRASAVYVAVVGWQPLVAYALVRRFVLDARPFDVGIGPIAVRDSLASVIVAVIVLALAVTVEAV